MAKNEVVVITKVETGDSAEQIEEVSKATEGLNDNLKETQKEAKETEKKLDKATDAVGRMPGPIGSAVDGFKNMVKSFKDIIASPVGMTLAAVAVVLGTLTALLSNFSPIVDFLADKIALLSGAFSGLQNQFVSLIQGTGFSTEKIKEQALAMQEAERMTRDYEDSISSLNLTQAKQERQIDVNLKKLRNKTLTEKESNAIIAQTIQLQKQQIADLQKNQQVETEILKKKVLGYGGTYKQILAIVKGTSIAELNTGNEKLDEALRSLQGNYTKRTQEVSAYEQKYERIQNVRDSQDQKYKSKAEERQKKAEELATKRAAAEQKRIDDQKKQQDDLVSRTEKEYTDTNKLTDEYYKKKQLALIQSGATEQEIKKQQQDLELKELEQKIQNAKDYGQSTVDLELQLAQKKANINKEATDAQKKLDEETLKQKEKDADAQKKIDEDVAANRVKSLESASSTLKTFSNLLGETTAEGKALAIAATTIDTYKAAQSAYASLAGIPVVGPALGAAAAAAAIASGLATVNKILSVQVPGGGSGGSVPSAPPMTRPSSSFTRIDNSTPLDVNNTGATKVYVTETDITNTQKKVDAIKAKAVIG